MLFAFAFLSSGHRHCDNALCMCVCGEVEGVGGGESGCKNGENGSQIFWWPVTSGKSTCALLPVIMVDKTVNVENRVFRGCWEV